MLDTIKQRLKQRSLPILGLEQMSQYSVVIPLLKQQDGSLAILFEIRSNTLRRQPGEISFPGGKIESFDASPMAAGIRETAEELGINQEEIAVLHQLGSYVHFQQIIIYPFVAEITTDNLNINQEEVADIFLVPLPFFINTKPQKYKINIKSEPEIDFPFHLIPNGENYRFRFRNTEELFYTYNNNVIWGMTARLLYNFINLIKD